MKKISFKYKRILNKVKFSQKLFLGFSIIITIMICILAYTFINYVKETEAINSNLSSYEIIEEANSIFISLLNMETGARGYALAGKDNFLEPFNQGEIDFEINYHSLKELTNDNDSQKKRLVQLKKIYSNWYKWETTKIIDGRKKVIDGKLKMEEIITLVQTDRAKNKMDSIRALLKEIIKEEQKTLTVSYENLNAAEQRTGYIITFGGLIAVLLSVLISLFTSKSISRPIKILIKSTENITKQDYQELIDLTSDQEFAILIQRFNDMQNAIQLREDELNKKNEMLKVQMVEVNEANRLKSQFLANMSHELRTPLNSIIGFTNRVLKKSSDFLPEIQKENLCIVLDEAKHLLELINSLLDYSKIEAGKMEIHTESFNLLSVIGEVYTMTKTLGDGKDIDYIQESFQLDNIPIISDRLKIKQILINLLSNAFKYSEKGTITLSVNIEDNFYRICVKDEGVGIAPDDLKHIFEEFRQVDGTYARKVGGTGLGLSITKKFIEMLGGEIKVDSQLGLGSCFQVRLPIHFTVDSILVDEIDLANPSNKKRVLCIDDDNNVQRLYKQYLNEYDIDVISLNGQENIIEKVREILPDVILLDIMLPNKDGWEILAELKYNDDTKRIPVIMASVLSEEKLAYRMKADEFLIKPVSQEELIETITRTTSDKNGVDILVADDDVNFLKLIGQFLKEEDIPYRLSNNGEDVMKQILIKKPDLLILDIMMPKKDGFTVLEEIRKINEIKDTPVIIVTAKDLTNKERDELRDRANSVIQKSAVMMDTVMQTLIKRIKENL